MPHHAEPGRVDPGPDGVYGNGDDANVQAFNLSDTATPSNNTTRNIDGYENDFKTIEFAVNKRYSNRWSMNASYAYNDAKETFETIALEDPTCGAVGTTTTCPGSNQWLGLYWRGATSPAGVTT